MDAKQKYYPFDTSGCSYLSINNSIYVHSELLSDYSIRVIECDIQEKSMKVKTRNKNSSEWIEMNMDSFIKNDIVDLNENGTRWEGDSLNGSPLGYGRIYNPENQLIYKGFMFEGMKVCFGEEYYGDIGIVEYEGNYYKNMKNGYGKLYDKKNELVYEGEWLNDKSLHEECLKIENELYDNSIHFGINELIIGDNCECSISDLTLIGFNHLRLLEIGDNSLMNVNNVELSSMNYC